jgi:hypothetical protein
MGHPVDLLEIDSLQMHFPKRRHLPQPDHMSLDQRDGVIHLAIIIVSTPVTIPWLHEFLCAAQDVILW